MKQRFDRCLRETGIAIRHSTGPVFFALLLLLTSASGHAAAGLPDMQQSLRPVVRLLEVIDTLKARNPGWKQEAAALDSMPYEQRGRHLEELARENARDTVVVSAVKGLLEHPAYRFYFGHTGSVDWEIYAHILYCLPFAGARPSPAGIGDNLHELCLHEGAIRDWVTGLAAKVDPESAIERARRWAPSGDSSLPTIYFLYDGNRGGFASDDTIYLDLFGLYLGERPRDIRYTALDSMSMDRAEAVMAHELQHDFARPYIYPANRPRGTWDAVFADRIARQLVSEGSAMHCNPPEGLKAQIFNDTGVARYWIGELSRMMRLVEGGGVTEDECRQWQRDSFHKAAEDELRVWFSRTMDTDTADSAARAHPAVRPDLIHMLGWWIVSRISGGTDRERVIALVQDPTSLFERYNEAVADRYPDLVIDVH